MVRHAAHPILGPVPASSEAVVFNDTAELLACMAADWCKGLLPTHWWWKSLFKTNDVTSLLLPTWLDAPSYAPAALQHLAVRNLVIPFVRSLSNDDARLLLQKILYTFSLHTLYQALYSSENDTAIDTSDENAAFTANNQTAGTAYDTQFIAPATSAPWQHVVPVGSQFIAGRNELESYWDQQCLLGIGLMLQRAPATVRTVAFARAVQHWRNATSTTVRDDQKPSDKLFTTEISLGREMSSVSIGEGAADAEGRGPLGRPIPQRIVDVHHSSAKGNPKVPHLCSDERPVLPSAEQEATHNNQNIIPDAPLDQHETTVFLPDAQIIETPLEIEIDTAFGGLFYLINLALFLGLYNDFTMPMNPGIELPIWDFIALLGQYMLGEIITQDPIWSLLAQLAERDVHDAPGKDFTPPAQWPVQFSSEEGGVVDGQGPLWSSTVNQGKGAQGWLDRLMPFIYTRLQLALDLDSQDQVATMLCIHEAHVRVTATHLDVFFSLNTLPIEIRLAGLDRNPGWVPSAGRFVVFHFA
jgi:hypothetical protein